jgi:hypothetical protein
MKFNLHTVLIILAIVLAVISGTVGVIPLWIPVVALGVSVLIMIRGMG